MIEEQPVCDSETEDCTSIANIAEQEPIVEHPVETTVKEHLVEPTDPTDI